VGLAAGLAACGARDRIADAARQPNAATPERAYSAPPTVTTASRLAGGRIQLEGRARPGAQVRLATPAGAAILARADGRGAWRLRLPPDVGLRLFGLSMSEGARIVQAEGYLAVTPRGAAAQLRAGAGAVVLSPGGAAPHILAVDFDRQGGAVVSGDGAPGTPVILKADGSPRGQLRVDAGGRFSLALNEPLTPGDHRLEAVGPGPGAASAAVTVPVSAAAPLTQGPFRAARAPFGWRIDWMTPGGGVQTSLIIAPQEAAS